MVNPFAITGNEILENIIFSYVESVLILNIFFIYKENLGKCMRSASVVEGRAGLQPS